MESQLKDLLPQESAPHRLYFRFVQMVHAKLKNFEIPSLVFLFMLPKEAFRPVVTLDWIAASGGFLASLGFGLRFFSRGYAKEERFVLDGPYRYVRNPDELGSLLFYSGMLLCLRVQWTWILCLDVSALIYFYWVSMSYEEILKIRAGVVYAKYVQRVRRWIPSTLPAVNPSRVPFSWKRAAREDKAIWLWIFGAILVLLYRRYYLR